ncbi:hypothetical protein VNO77_17199 [Canavalia gladiata]|uniref:WRC domain-containing protein n=1 Tax=Canavalia gladiata TaxID=3824 RepID=A0AAN9LNE3_CANGL
MRIRKRQVLFPSSLSPLPLSDPHLINRSPVVVQLSHATSTTAAHAVASASTLDRRQPSDQPLPSIGKPTNGCDDPSGIGHCGVPHGQHKKLDPLEEDVRGEESGEDSGEKSNHNRKERVFSLEIQGEVLPPPPLPAGPSLAQDGRWCEGEKAIPLKKRRGSFEENNGKKMKARMKTKMNKKCCMRNNEDNMEEEEVEEEETKLDVNNNVSKKRARGGALMEGSRCSRVNGRGWRCCQQTLVGYSLCEHHLGKGRLRSMASVRNRSLASTTAPNKVIMHHIPDYTSVSSSSSSSSSSSLEKPTKCVNDHPLGEDEIYEKKPVIITKKRMKLGMVKARSISSLLGQTNTHNIALPHQNNK